MSINKVMLTGNLTRDPEVRRTQSGMSIMRFGIAVNERRKNNRTGEWDDYANFVDCVMFGDRAEKVSSYISKGSKVAVDGSLRYSAWEKDGQKRSKIEVVVDDIDFELPPKQQAPQGYAPQQPPQVYPQQQAYPQQGYQQPAPQAYQPQYQQPQAYQQPQGYAQPASAPQAPPQATYQPQQQYAPQQPPQPQAAPPQQPQQMQMPQPVTQQPAVDVYDEDIPF